MSAYRSSRQKPRHRIFVDAPDLVTAVEISRAVGYSLSAVRGWLGPVRSTSGVNRWSWHTDVVPMLLRRGLVVPPRPGAE